MEIIKEKDMKLLSRKRVILMRDNKGATPSRQELIQEVASMFKVKEDLIIIKHVYSQFGENRTKIIVHIYNDKKKMGLFEHSSLLKKHEKKASAEPQEPKKEAQPEPEEKKETSSEKEEEKQES
jgi:ribosomal protein S24E